MKGKCGNLAIRLSWATDRMEIRHFVGSAGLGRVVFNDWELCLHSSPGLYW
jgi:hypothetical protein